MYEIYERPEGNEFAWEFWCFFYKKWQIRASTLQICLENISKRTCTGDRPSEWYRGQNWWGGMCISRNSWWRCSIARTSKICLDWHQKSDFEFNSNLHSRHSCNQNMQNIVTWGQNMSANIEEFACISMEELFSGVPPSKTIV